MRMKNLSLVAVCASFLCLTACVFESSEPTKRAEIKTTLRGSLGQGDTIGGGGVSKKWEIPVDTTAIDSFRVSCMWTGYLGYSELSANYTNESMGPENGMPSAQVFGLVAPKDSSFTHYRIEIDCGF